MLPYGSVGFVVLFVSFLYSRYMNNSKNIAIKPCHKHLNIILTIGINAPF